MTLRSLPTICVVAALTHFALSTTQAGHLMEPAPDKSKIVEPAEDDWRPLGMVTLGGKFSEDLQSGYLDSMTPLLYKSGFMLALNTRTTIDDNSQDLSSYGLVARYMVPNHDIIIGANVFYDSIDSQFSNHFDQLGIGVELLTRWFDARANWYLPDDSAYEIGSFTRTSKNDGGSSTFVQNGEIRERSTETERRTRFKSFESAFEGYNLEAGFLVPGVDKYFELRLLAGYYRYESQFGRTYEGVKARLEARFLPGVIGDLEYWDDPILVGGHWVAGVRVTVPFSLGNIFVGKNPFEGFEDSFRPRKREFRERMSEMVIRSHRVITSDSGPKQGSTSTSKETSEKVVGTVPAPVVVAPPPLLL